MNAMFGHVTAKRNQDGTRGRQRIEKITEKQLHSVARRYQVRYQRQYEPAYTPEPERREQLATTAAAESRPVSAGARCRPFAGSTARPVRDAQPDAHATRSPPRHSPPRLCGCSQGSAPPTSRRPSSASTRTVARTAVVHAAAVTARPRPHSAASARLHSAAAGRPRSAAATRPRYADLLKSVSPPHRTVSVSVCLFSYGCMFGGLHDTGHSLPGCRRREPAGWAPRRPHTA